MKSWDDGIYMVTLNVVIHAHSGQQVLAHISQSAFNYFICLSNTLNSQLPRLNLTVKS